LARDFSAGRMTVVTTSEQTIIEGLDVAHVRDDGQAYGLFVEILCRG
jgi:hypothetical protein